MNRPQLTKSLSKFEFQKWYWLKKELVEFCRARGLPTPGSKEQIIIRIEKYFDGETISCTKRSAKNKLIMPNSFSVETVITEDWRCSQSLRVFFEAEFGKSFRFNEALRSFISTKIGHTLNEAMECYRASLIATKRPIAKQFEYNIHMREYHKNNPKASHAEAVDSWWDKRGNQNS